MTQFRDVRQRARVCRALLARVHLEDLWSEYGPSVEGLGLRHDGSGRLAPDASLLLGTAWALWNGTRSLTLADLLDLDGEHLCVVGELLAAMSRGPHEVDGWLAQWADSRECRRARGTVPPRRAG
jgi:hypothetical protein